MGLTKEVAELKVSSEAQKKRLDALEKARAEIDPAEAERIAALDRDIASKRAEVASIDASIAAKEKELTGLPAEAVEDARRVLTDHAAVIEALQETVLQSSKSDPAGVSDPTGGLVSGAAAANVTSVIIGRPN